MGARALVVAAALGALPAAELVWRAVERLGCPASPAVPAFDLYVAGESTALGTPYDRDGLSLAALVLMRGDGRLGGLPVNVVELAKAGQSIYPQAVALAETLRCRDRSRPGAVILYTGHNDEGAARGESLLMKLPRSRLLEALLYRLEARVPALRTRTFDTWAFHLRRALDAAQAAGTTVVLAVPVSDPREAAGASFGLATPLQRDFIRELARERSLPLVDLEAAFAGRPDLFIDAQHPSMPGYLLLADGYARALGLSAPGPRDAAAAFAAAGCGARCQAQALSQAGWWWLSVSVGLAAPEKRRAAARARFTAALKLDGGHYGARLGLALAGRPDVLASPEKLARLGRLQVFHARAGEFDVEARAELSALLGREP